MTDQKTFKQVKAQATKEKMLEVARDIILHEGIERLSMNRVAELSGMSKGAVMYHFKTKRELIAALLEDYANHLNSNLESREKEERTHISDPEEAFLAAYINWFRDFDRDNHGWAQIGVSLLAQFFTDPDLVEPVRDWYRKLFSRLGSLQKEEQPKAFLSVMALEGFFFTHKFGLDLMKPEEKEMVYQQILSFFLPVKSSDKVKKASKK